MVISLDLETSSLDKRNCDILLNGYRLDAQGEVIYAPTDSICPILSSYLSDPGTVLRGHHIVFDALTLASHGYNVQCRLEDTRVLAYLNWPTLESHGLKYLVKEKLRRAVTSLDEILFKPLKRELKHLELHRDFYYIIDEQWVRKDLLKEYHKEDVLNIDRLRNMLTPTDWFKDVEMPLTRMLFEMELYGCPLDNEQLTSLLERYTASRTGLHDKLQQMAPHSEEAEEDCRSSPEGGKEVNFNSSDQIREILTKKGYKLEEICDKTPKGKYKVDAALLKELSHKGDEFCKVLLEYRRYSKILSTYIEPFLRGSVQDGRLHGGTNQAGTEDLYGDGARGTNTGRLSSSNPNLQNIPSRTKEGKEVRKAFIASKDAFMFDTDLSQIEPRLVAHYSQATKLIHAYANNVDTHGLFANEIFGKECGKDSIERFIGKSSWLATVYGCSYRKLLYICQGFTDGPLTLPITEAHKEAFNRLDYKEQLKIQKEVGIDYRKIHAQWMFFKDVQTAFERLNPDIFAWRQNHIDRTRRIGYLVTLGGRKIAVDGLNSRDWGVRFSAERQAVNYQIQGSAADAMKLIMIRAQNELVVPKKGRIFAVVHDELLGELYDKSDVLLVKDIMENTCTLRNVQIKAETKLVDNWSQK